MECTTMVGPGPSAVVTRQVPESYFPWVKVGCSGLPAVFTPENQHRLLYITVHYSTYQHLSDVFCVVRRVDGIPSSDSALVTSQGLIFSGCRYNLQRFSTCSVPRTYLFWMVVPSRSITEFPACCVAERCEKYWVVPALLSVIVTGKGG